MGGSVMRTSRRTVIVAAATLGALIVAGGLTAILSAGGGHARLSRHESLNAPLTASPPSSALSGEWIPVPPATTVPADSPAQQHYDRGFEQGFASASNQAELAALEAIRLPEPGIGGGWPTLAVSNTPGGWARQFATGLLDVNFAAQHRSALGSWLVAAEAPDLMPGVPPGGQYGGLYATLLEPAVTGQPSPIPSPSQWKAYATAGVHWSVSGLQIQLDPQWQSMIDAGWQPRDLRGAVEDLSGLLTVTTGATSTAHRFSFALQLGSARWNDGYGSVLLAGWKES